MGEDDRGRNAFPTREVAAVGHQGELVMPRYP